MFESAQHKQKQQGTDKSTAADDWAPSWQRMLTTQNAAYASDLVQRRGNRTKEPTGYPTVKYDMNAMLSNVRQGMRDTKTRSHLPLQRTMASENEKPEEKPVTVQMVQSAQLQTDTSAVENRTGMSDRLKSGLEQLSGFDLSHVRVHRNSAKPAQLNALAYAQGRDIHLGPGQERQLPHEGWHVVQQMQGRVRPTMALNGAAINDDIALEKEADRMGAKAVGH